MITLPNSLAVFIVTGQQLLRYNTADGSTAVIALAGGATPTTGGATLDSASIYVGGSDGKVHRIDVGSNTDAQQIDPTLGQVNDLLVAVRPH